MRKLFVLLLAALVQSACGDATARDWKGTIADSAGVKVVSNPETGLWSGDHRPTLTEDLKIGNAEGDPDYQFGQINPGPGGLDVDGDGNVYVLDVQARKVRVFDAAGTFLRTIGGPGSGPGELSMAATGVLVAAGDTIIVPDQMQQRVNRYLPDGTPAGTFPMPMQSGLALRWTTSPTGAIVQQSRIMAFPGQDAANVKPRDLILSRSSDGTVQDTLLELKSGNTVDFSGGLPRIRMFEAEPVWTLDSNGALVHAVNSEYRFEVLNADGTVAYIVRKPFERKAVTDADKEGFRKLMKDAFEKQGVPPQMMEPILNNVSFAEFYPAFAQLMGGPDGTIWVQQIQSADDIAARNSGDQAPAEFNPQDIGSPRWDIFDTEGRFLGTIELPERFQPVRVIDNHIYGIWRDDLDVQYVKRLTITGLTAT